MSNNDKIHISGDLVNGDKLGGDKVGRDKIMIQNLVYVGRFLDLANAEQLLSLKPVSEQEYQEISANLDNYIDQHLRGDLAEALAKVGKILLPAMTENMSGDRFTPHNYPALIGKILNIVDNQCLASGYYQEYGERIRAVVAGQPVEYYTVIWFTAVNKLWEKHLSQNISWGIYNRFNAGINRFDCFVIKSFDNTFSFFEPGKIGLKRHEYRVFLLGVFLDLTRMINEDLGDKAFLDGLVDLID